MPHFRVIVLPCGRREIEQIVERPAVSPEIVERARAAGLELSDAAVAFLADSCALAPGETESAAAVYAAYLRWAGGKGQAPVTQTRLGRQLTKLGLVPSKRGFRGRIVREGIRLRR